jgi:hypothetical protein
MRAGLLHAMSCAIASTPIVVFAHIPPWTVYLEWDWAPNPRGVPVQARGDDRGRFVST